MQEWIGREQVKSELLASSTVQKFNATLDRATEVRFGELSIEPGVSARLQF